MGKKSKDKDATLEEGIENCTLEEPELTYEEKLKFVNVIAKPMATKSQAKKIYKLVKKSAKEAGCLRSGLKDVQKYVRVGERGICVFAGDVSPFDIMVHMPAVCEEKEIPYCYVPSKKDLGAVTGFRRASIMVLVKPNKAYQELYDEVVKELKSMPIPIDSENSYIISQKFL